MKTELEKMIDTSGRFSFGFVNWPVFGVHRGSVAEIGPIDVRPEFFATHSTVGGTFDGWATVGRYATRPSLPLANQRRRYSKPASQRRRTFFLRGVLLEVHAAKSSVTLYVKQ